MLSVYHHSEVPHLKLEQVQTFNLSRHPVSSELNSLTNCSQTEGWRLVFHGVRYVDYYKEE